MWLQYLETVDDLLLFFVRVQRKNPKDNQYHRFLYYIWIEVRLLFPIFYIFDEWNEISFVSEIIEILKVLRLKSILFLIK